MQAFLNMIWQHGSVAARQTAVSKCGIGIVMILVNGVKSDVINTKSPNKVLNVSDILLMRLGG